MIVIDFNKKKKLLLRKIAISTYDNCNCNKIISLTRRLIGY